MVFSSNLTLWLHCRSVLLCCWISHICIRFALLTLKSPLVPVSPPAGSCWSMKLPFASGEVQTISWRAIFQPRRLQWEFEKEPLLFQFILRREKMKIDLENGTSLFHPDIYDCSTCFRNLAAPGGWAAWGSILLKAGEKKMERIRFSLQTTV